MADPRLIAAAAALVAGCNAARAEPELAPEVRVPAGWQELPGIASAARMAAGAAGVTVDGVAAWGEPARGCYAIWIALHGAAGTPAQLRQQVLDSLAAEQLAVRDVRDGERLALAIARPARDGGVAYRGRLEARFGDGRVAALACVGNEREPAACDAACKPVLATWEAR